MKRILLVILLMFVLVGEGFCATYTIDDSGGKDYTTIQAALTANAGAHTFEVYSGTYNEAINTTAANQIIKGVAGETVIIDSTGDGDDTVETTSGNGGLTLQNVTLRGADDGASYRLLRIDHAGTSLIEDVTFEGGDRQLVVSVANNTFNRCKFKDHTTSDQSDVVSLQGAAGSGTFNFCLFDNVKRVSSTNGTAWTFNNCIWTGSYDRAYIGGSGNAQTSAFTNCLFYGVGDVNSPVIVNNAGTMTLTNCDVVGGRNPLEQSVGGTSTITITDNINIAPRWVNHKYPVIACVGVDMGTTANLTYFTELADVAETYGCRVSGFVPSENNDYDAADWTQVRTYSEAGHDIGGHSRWHPHMGDLAGESLDVEYTGAASACLAVYANRGFKTYEDDALAEEFDCNTLAVGSLATAINAVAGYTSDTDNATYAGNPRRFTLTENTNMITSGCVDDFTCATWDDSYRASVTADQETCPDGNNADLLSEDGSDNTHFIRYQRAHTDFTDDTFYHFVVYVKQANSDRHVALGIQGKDGTLRTSRFNLATGTVAGAGAGMVNSIDDLGNGWFRVSSGKDIVNGANVCRAEVFIASSTTSSYQGVNEYAGIYIAGAKWVKGIDIKTGSAVNFALDTTKVYADEIDGCISDLEDPTLLGKTITSWAYPHNSHDVTVRAALNTAGVKIARGGYAFGANSSETLSSLTMHMVYGPWMDDNMSIDKLDSLEGTAANFQVDTANTSGHFEDSGNTPVTIDTGNTCPLIIPYTYFKLTGDSTIYQISVITDDGEANDEVDFIGGNKATGTYAVDWIRRTTLSDSEAAIKASVSQMIGYAGANGGIISFYSHGSDEFTTTEWGYVFEVLRDNGVMVLTLADAYDYIYANGWSTADSGLTYTKTLTANEDYHLLSDSPCATTGSDIYDGGVYDLANVLMISGGTPVFGYVSMGAYQYFSSGGGMGLGLGLDL